MLKKELEVQVTGTENVATESATDIRTVNHQPDMSAVKSLSICVKRKTTLCQHHTCRIHFASGQIARTFMTNCH